MGANHQVTQEMGVVSQVVFNKQFIFCDELSLNQSTTEIVPSIYVREKPNNIISQIFTYKSSVFKMSKRSVYYHINQKISSSNLESLGLEVENVLSLIWQKSSQSIRYIKGKHYSPKLLEFWIYHTFFPIILSLEREYKVLHVGGVTLKEKAVLFSAFSFGGKSTLTAYFLKKGHEILGDDTVAIAKINHIYKAIASYPYYRPYRETETLGDTIENFLQSPIPLQAIYHLKSVDKNANVSIRTLYRNEKFQVLHHTFFIDFDFLKKEYFTFVGNISKEISVYEISIPWDLTRLEEVYQAIITHNRV